VLKTSVERLEGTTVKLTITVPAADVDVAIAEAYAAVGKKMRIPGFRKGHAPRPVVDNYVGRDHVLAEATEAVLNDYYPKAVDAEGLRPVESPETEALETVQQGEDFTFEANVVTRPELVLESADDIVVEIAPREVSDAEMEKQIDELLERFASLEPVEDRGLAENDYALMSFVGYVDGETYEGNEVDKYLYEMGRGFMPKDFDDGILGMKAGDDARVEFEISAASSKEEYVGKMAQFDVVIHEIKAKKLPDVDDEFAAQMGFDTLAEMKEDLHLRLDQQKQVAYDREKEKASREEIARRTPGDIPESMIQGRMRSLFTDFDRRLQDQGTSLEAYSEATGLTSEILEAELRKDAEQLIREDLALEALFRLKGMEVTDADIDDELAEIARATKSTPEEARKKWEDMGLMAVFSEGVMHRLAVGWLMENVTVVEVEPTEKTDDDQDEIWDTASEPEKPAKNPAKNAEKTDDDAEAEAVADAPADAPADAESTEE
jgi:trigger factor